MAQDSEVGTCFKELDLIQALYYDRSTLFPKMFRTPLLSQT
jgi:hypothetical protein